MPDTAPFTPEDHVLETELSPGWRAWKPPQRPCGPVCDLREALERAAPGESPLEQARDLERLSELTHGVAGAFRKFAALPVDDPSGLRSVVLARFAALMDDIQAGNSGADGPCVQLIDFQDVWEMVDTCNEHGWSPNIPKGASVHGFISDGYDVVSCWLHEDLMEKTKEDRPFDRCVVNLTKWTVLDTKSLFLSDLIITDARLTRPDVLDGPTPNILGPISAVGTFEHLWYRQIRKPHLNQWPDPKPFDSTRWFPSP